MIDFVQLAVTTPAGGGAAATDPVVRQGKILAVGLDYAASADAGTDVTVDVAGVVGPALTILAVSNSKTDGWYYPRAGAVSPANAAITNSAAPIPFYGQLRLTVAQAGGAITDAVKAVIIYEE